MSWKGFQKAVSRLPAMMSKAAGANATKDEEFAHYEDQLKQVDILARKLTDSTKSFKDSLSLMLAHQTSLAAEFAVIYAPLPLDEQNVNSNDAHYKASQNFSNAMTQARESLQSDLEQIERLIVAPTCDFIVILDHIKRILVKRSHKLLDYDRHGESVKQLREKPNRTFSDEKKLAQLEATFDQASRDYHAINNQIKQDLAVFLGLRNAFIDPCLLTFYNYQLRVYDTLYRIYYEVGNSQFDLSTSALDGYQHLQEGIVAMLTNLTLCKPVVRTQAASEGGSPVHNTAPPTYSQALNSHGVVRASYDGPTRAIVEETPQRISLELKKGYVVALYDFEAQAEGDLSFKKNDTIEVLQRSEDVNDWWTGSCNGRTGSFPGNYIKEL